MTLYEMAKNLLENGFGKPIDMSLFLKGEPMNFYEIDDKVKVWMHDGSSFTGKIVAVTSAIQSGNAIWTYSVQDDETHYTMHNVLENDLDMIHAGNWIMARECDMGCNAVGASRHVRTCSAWENI